MTAIAIVILMHVQQRSPVSEADIQTEMRWEYDLGYVQ